MDEATSNRTATLPARRRAVKLFLFLGVVIFLGIFVALRAVAGFFSKYDDPARLGGTTRLISTNGFTLRWVEKSAATNRSVELVFIHGSPGGAGIWAAQFRKPFPEANLFAYDRPGFGGSGPVLKQPHLQEQADALMTLLACATTNRVFLIGHSYGSPIALLAALEHPERIRGALLIGGDVNPAEEKPWLVQRFFGWSVTSWLLPRSLRQCNREMLTARADLRDMQKRLPRLTVPVLMLHGDHDPLVPVSNVDWLEQQLNVAGKSAQFEKIILPGANHFIPWERPDEVERAIRQLEKMADESMP